jgi:hypothetical protein
MSREHSRRTKAALKKAATSHPEVDEVVNRLIEVIGYCDCSPAPSLAAEMTANYLPGFDTVLSNFPNFWTQNRDKVLLMAGFAGAVACLFAARDRGVQFLTLGASGPEVTTENVMMAMAVVRSTCRIGLPPGGRSDGLPCNRVNLPLSAATKIEVIRAFADITMDLVADEG